MHKSFRWVILLLSVLTLSCAGVRHPGTDPDLGKDKRARRGRAVVMRAQILSAPPASPAPSGFETEHLWSSYTDWEPAIAADPSSSYVYQLTTRYDGPKACRRCPLPSIIFRSSADGGTTWNADKFLVIGKKPQNDPEIEVATDGTIYAVWLDDYVPGVSFIKSADHGATWSAPVAFSGKKKEPRWSDKPILAISPGGEHIYIAFNAGNSYVVASHDHGQTFSAPVKTNDDTRYWFHTGGAIAADGTAYFAATDYSQDFKGDSHINVLKSTDGGASWITRRVDTSAQMPDCPSVEGCYLGFLGPSAAIAVDQNGTVVIAYNAGDAPGAPQKMWVRHSPDGNQWSDRIDVSDNAPAKDNGFPALAAGLSAGDFRIVWQHGDAAAWNTTYRHSTDGGNTWSAPVRLSDQASGASYKSPAGFAFPFGDYLEMAVDSTGRNHIIWGEGDNVIGPGGTWYTRGFPVLTAQAKGNAWLDLMTGHILEADAGVTPSGPILWGVLSETGFTPSNTVENTGTVTEPDPAMTPGWIELHNGSIHYDYEARSPQEPYLRGRIDSQGRFHVSPDELKQWTHQ